MIYNDLYKINKQTNLSNKTILNKKYHIKLKQMLITS